MDDSLAMSAIRKLDNANASSLTLSPFITGRTYIIKLPQPSKQVDYVQVARPWPGWSPARANS